MKVLGSSCASVDQQTKRRNYHAELNSTKVSFFLEKSCQRLWCVKTIQESYVNIMFIMNLFFYKHQLLPPSSSPQLYPCSHLPSPLTPKVNFYKTDPGSPKCGHLSSIAQNLPLQKKRAIFLPFTVTFFPLSTLVVWRAEGDWSLCMMLSASMSGRVEEGTWLISQKPDAHHL